MNEIDSLPLEQRRIAYAILNFIDDSNPGRQYYLYEGLAGTGKTHVLAAVARLIGPARSVLCSFMGKTASNLSRRTGLKATTIHSAIYDFLGKDVDSDELLFEIKEDADAGAWAGKIAFVDESGTVGQRLARDLLATGCKVVCCGDPGQLPPVNDTRFFTGPDATLTEPHRQALDSAIIRQAWRIRQTGRYAADGDDFRVVRHVEKEDITQADAVLCWRNATRIALNRLIRAHHGYGAGAPFQVGEKVMCLRNNHKLGIMNGAVYELQREHRRGDDYVVVRNERGWVRDIPRAWIEDFDQPHPSRYDAPFAPAYAMTVHKFIGSEADDIILVDEYDRSDLDYTAWAYTAVTRAAKRMTVLTQQ